MVINAREVGPDGEGTGWWRAQLYKEDWGGWRRLDGRVVRLISGEYQGDPAVVVLIQITRAEGWGTGGEHPDPALGEYGWFWFHDGGPHRGQSNDHWTNMVFQDDPFKEYWPYEPDPFHYFDPGEWVVPVIGGNLTIHGI
jgi:hypothetical protein